MTLVFVTFKDVLLYKNEQNVVSVLLPVLRKMRIFAAKSVNRLGSCARTLFNMHSWNPRTEDTSIINQIK